MPPIPTAVPLSWYLMLQRDPVCAGRRRVPVPQEHHHRVHVHRADAQRCEPELHRVLVPVQAGGRPHLLVFVMVVAAAEAAVGLGIILTVFKNRATLEIDEVELRLKKLTDASTLADSRHSLWPAFAINGLFGRQFPKALVNVVAIGSVLLSFLWVLKICRPRHVRRRTPEEAHVEHYFTWIQSGDFNIGFDLAVDRLSAVMLLVVTGIGC